MNKPWERQETDTPASFAAFSKYFLTQTPPRNLTEAYRQYCADTGKKVGEKITKPVRIWRSWYEDGDWRERAAKLDDVHLKKDVIDWGKEQTRIRTDDLKAGQKLREVARKILKNFEKFITSSTRMVRGESVRTETEQDGTKIIKITRVDKQIITVALDARLAIRALEAATKLERVAAEMITDKTVYQHTGKIAISDVAARMNDGEN